MTLNSVNLSAVNLNSDIDNQARQRKTDFSPDLIKQLQEVIFN